MRYETVDAIFTVLKRYPNGATAKQVNAELNWPGTATSQRLGKLYFYNIIDRVPAPGRRTNLFRYQIKQHELGARSGSA